MIDKDTFHGSFANITKLFMEEETTFKNKKLNLIVKM